MNFKEKTVIVEKIQKINEEELVNIIKNSSSPDFNNIYTKNDILRNFNLLSVETLIYISEELNKINIPEDNQTYSIFHTKKKFRSNFISYILSMKNKVYKKDVNVEIIKKPKKRISKKIEKKIIELDSDDNSVYEYFSHYYDEIGNSINSINFDKKNSSDTDTFSDTSSENSYASSLEFSDNIEVVSIEVVSEESDESTESSSEEEEEL